MQKSFERLPIFKIGATAFEQFSRMNGIPIPGMKLDVEDDRVQHSIKEALIVTYVQSRETMQTRWRVRYFEAPAETLPILPRRVYST